MDTRFKLCEVGRPGCTDDREETFFAQDPASTLEGIGVVKWRWMCPGCFGARALEAEMSGAGYAESGCTGMPAGPDGEGRDVAA